MTWYWWCTQKSVCCYYQRIAGKEKKEWAPHRVLHKCNPWADDLQNTSHWEMALFSGPVWMFKTLFKNQWRCYFFYHSEANECSFDKAMRCLSATQSATLKIHKIILVIFNVMFWRVWWCLDNYWKRERRKTRERVRRKKRETYQNISGLYTCLYSLFLPDHQEK